MANYPMERGHTHVWVLEMLCQDANGDPHRWEIWSAHNTRQEAVEERDKPTPKGILLPRPTTRIRKYVPAVRRG